MLKVKDMWPEEALLPNFVDWADNVDSNPFLQMLEFMKHGDMNSMLNKVAHSDTAHMIREQGYFSKICWKIFICRKYLPNLVVDLMLLSTFAAHR